MIFCYTRAQIGDSVTTSFITVHLLLTVSLENHKPTGPGHMDINKKVEDEERWNCSSILGGCKVVVKCCKCFKVHLCNLYVIYHMWIIWS